MLFNYSRTELIIGEMEVLSKTGAATILDLECWLGRCSPVKVSARYVMINLDNPVHLRLREFTYQSSDILDEGIFLTFASSY